MCRFVNTIFVLFLLPRLVHGADVRDYKEWQLFSNAAFAICIGQAFRTKPVVEDAHRTASGYLEYSHMPFAAYLELQKQVGFWLDKKYPGKSGGSLQLMKCIDYYNSGDIRSLYNKFDPCVDRILWPDVHEYGLRCQ